MKFEIKGFVFLGVVVIAVSGGKQSQSSLALAFTWIGQGFDKIDIKYL